MVKMSIGRSHKLDLMSVSWGKLAITGTTANEEGAHQVYISSLSVLDGN